ncbi:MAG: WYL domain-containing protein [Muribaculaceae bacterium]|nr:WYL domain-containing protein [Muribaculaceae bacterium]
MTRYRILDELLSNRYHNYSLDDLTEEVNIRLGEMDPASVGVVRRTIEKDIRYLEVEGPFMVEIERYTVPLTGSGRTRLKHCVRYADNSYSIFKQPMTIEEKHLLREVMSLLGRFDGLPEMGSLERLRRELQIGEDITPVVSFSKNPIENTTVLAQLFMSINHHQVVKIDYRTFVNPDKCLHLTVHPYLLKEFNRRWYVIGAVPPTMKLLTLALDRVVDIEAVPEVDYHEPPADILERYEDIVGVTYVEESPVLDIVFWVSDQARGYVETKPIHESHTPIRGESELVLRQRNPMLKGGAFYRIRCKENYELLRELTSYGNDLLVISPTGVRDKIEHRATRLCDAYKALRT